MPSTMAQTSTTLEMPDTKASFIPGTIHLVDLEGTLHAKHASGSGGRKDIVLVPTPSSDPNDPLNWTLGRKWTATACMCIYTLMVGIASAAIYSVLEPISEATGLSLADLNSGTGYMFLFMGWGCLVWQPLALQYGKRPVYLFSILATMAITVWAPYTKTKGQWIANKILQGFFGAPIESLCEISVTDIYFTHERGTYVALYGLLLAGSNFFAPIIAGFIAQGQGWEWVLYWCAIFCAIGFVILFFFLEETNFHRHTITGQEPETDTASPVDETTVTGKSPDTEKANEPWEKSTANLSRQVDESKKTKSFLQKMRLFEPDVFSYPTNLIGMMTRPLIFLTFPVIAYSGFSYGSNLVWFNVLNGTASLILSKSPYNFGSQIVGLAYVAPLLGVVVSTVYTGTFGSWFVVRMARWNKGIMEPEHRLWLFCANVLLIPFGLLLWGVGAQHHVHWFGLIFAMGAIAATNMIGLQISLSYCIDSYRDLSGEAIVTVIIIRNTMSFAISYGITPWVTNMGYQNAFITAAFAGLAQVLTFLIFVKWGKGLRERSRDRYMKYVREMAKTGLVH